MQNSAAFNVPCLWSQTDERFYNVLPIWGRREMTGLVQGWGGIWVHKQYGLILNGCKAPRAASQTDWKEMEEKLLFSSPATGYN